MRQNEPNDLAGSKVVRTRTDDGFKFYLDDGSWVLMRMSGTEPLMRVYAEATTRERVEQLITALENQSGVSDAHRGRCERMSEASEFDQRPPAPDGWTSPGDTSFAGRSPTATSASSSTSNQGHLLSLQYHVQKDECIYIQSRSDGPPARGRQRCAADAQADPWDERCMSDPDGGIASSRWRTPTSSKCHRRRSMMWCARG